MLAFLCAKKEYKTTYFLFFCFCLENKQVCDQPKKLFEFPSHALKGFCTNNNCSSSKSICCKYLQRECMYASLFGFSYGSTGEIVWQTILMGFLSLAAVKCDIN